MSMYDTIQSDMLTARKARDTFKVNVLNTLKGELGRECDGKLDTLTDDKIIKVIRKSVEALVETNKAKPNDDFVKEINILSAYLPRMMTEKDIKFFVANVINNTGATSMKDMGKVMGELKKAGPTMDMKIAQGFVKDALQ